MSLPIVKYGISIVFTEPVLGTQPQKDIAKEYLIAKAISEGHIDSERVKHVDDPASPDDGYPADEMGTLDEELAKGTTAFHRLGDGRAIFYDYQIKGFIKEAASVNNGHLGVKNAKSKADNYVFVFPRQVILQVPEGEEVKRLSRPLRGMTMQGPRVSIVSSEMLPVGTRFEVVLEVLEKGGITEELLRDWFSYGRLKGIGQWRNGSYGRFQFSLTQLED